MRSTLILAALALCACPAAPPTDAPPADDDDATADDDDATADDDDATADDDDATNNARCAEPGDSEVRFDPGVDGWQAVAGEVTYDPVSHVLTATSEAGEVLAVSFQPQGVDLVPLVTPALGAGTLFVAETGGDAWASHGTVILRSDEEAIFAVGFTSPGHPASQAALGIELSATPVDDACPEPEWQDDCGPATASSIAFLIDSVGPGVFTQQWPGGTTTGTTVGGEFSFALYSHWRLIEELCDDYPAREYSWSFVWAPGIE